jgi:hypothetical protein
VGNGIILGVLLLAVGAKVMLVFPFEENQKVFEKSLPLGAVDYLRQHRPEGRLFNSYNWGGYLLWALPEYPVFVDGRTDLYDDEIIREWLRVVRGEAGWQSVLDRWEVKVVLLERDWPLVRLLPGEGWHLWYEDDLSVVYGRGQ